MLYYGETARQHKLWLLDNIRVNKRVITSLKSVECDITPLQTEIREWFNEMIQLERWRKAEGLEPNQGYTPPSVRRKFE